MLTGKPLFAGETISDTLASVLRDDIDWTALPATTPDRIRRLLTRCLDRDVKQRLQAIGEARIVLDSRDDWTGPSASSVRSPPPPSGSRRLLWWAASTLVSAIAAAIERMVARPRQHSRSCCDPAVGLAAGAPVVTLRGHQRRAFSRWWHARVRGGQGRLAESLRSNDGPDRGQAAGGNGGRRQPGLLS